MFFLFPLFFLFTFPSDALIVHFVPGDEEMIHQLREMHQQQQQQFATDDLPEEKRSASVNSVINRMFSSLLGQSERGEMGISSKEGGQNSEPQKTKQPKRQLIRRNCFFSPMQCHLTRLWDERNEPIMRLTM